MECPPLVTKGRKSRDNKPFQIPAKSYNYSPRRLDTIFNEMYKSGKTEKHEQKNMSAAR